MWAEVRVLAGSSLDPACAAVRTQIAALERYYELATPELVAHRGADTLPGSITRAEAARWAELVATLERLERRDGAA
jgi:hypothetical protein